jgi:hypothetical protein
MIVSSTVLIVVHFAGVCAMYPRIVISSPFSD